MKYIRHITFSVLLVLLSINVLANTPLGNWSGKTLVLTSKSVEDGHYNLTSSIVHGTANMQISQVKDGFCLGKYSYNNYGKKMAYNGKEYISHQKSVPLICMIDGNTIYIQVNRVLPGSQMKCKLKGKLMHCLYTRSTSKQSSLVKVDFKRESK